MDTDTARIAGIDEAGRGPLAGPVVVAAVILAAHVQPPGLTDSKRLSASRRERLAVEIAATALATRVEVVEVEEIDRCNILQATLNGMRRACLGLRPAPSAALVDGNHWPRLPLPGRAVVGGDAIEPAISAASILAKVSRDRLMGELATRFPDYGFERHKGYPTRDHLEALRRLGPCPLHRRSFKPVRDCLAAGWLLPR